MSSRENYFSPREVPSNDREHEQYPISLPSDIPDDDKN